MTSKTLALLAATLCLARPARAQTTRPALVFDAPALQSSIGQTYADALHNLLDLNTVRDSQSEHDPLGRMDPTQRFIRAGAAYHTPWTRDASVNTWCAGNLLEPAVARNTLWAVVRKLPDGTLAVQQDNQWWDQCIWITAAWDHYCATGDRAFLDQAYPVAKRTLEIAREKHFNKTYGLFEGPAFFADGIAAYPPPEYDAKNKSSFVLDHPYSNKLMCLSTNCLYRAAYIAASEMATHAAPSDTSYKTAAEALAAHRWLDDSDALANAINTHLWSKEKQTYAYFLHGEGPDKGNPFFAQEGMGLSFAILFNVANNAQTAAILKHLQTTPHGIPTLAPHLPQFSETNPGRHNMMIWPLVNGYFATAATHAGNTEAFATELTRLTDLIRTSKGTFYEIYNPTTGRPDGGWQAGHTWDPLPDQTWSATAYIAAIHRGLFGLDYTPDHLELHPALPANFSPVELQNLPYRHATLTIRLTGSGTRIKKVTLDGQPISHAEVSGSLTGPHHIEIALRP